jgi:hypothetical protein
LNGPELIVGKLMELFEVYEIMRETVDSGTANLRKALAFQSVIDGLAVDRDKETHEIVGIAFYWRISDPLDLDKSRSFPGTDPAGKYVYLPSCYIVPHKRGHAAIKIIRRLLKLCASRCPGVSRWAYHRKNDKAIHVLKVK